MGVFPFNPNTGRGIQGSDAGANINIPALAMGYIAHWSKTPVDDDATDFMVDGQVLPAAGTTTLVPTMRSDVQTIDPGGATAGSFTLGFDGQVYAGGTNQVTNVDVGTSTSGTFTLTVYGQTTTALAWNITKAALQTALRLLSKLGNDVTVTGTDGGQSGTPFILTFTGAHGSVPVVVTGDSTSLAGGTHTVTITSATPGVGIAYNASATVFAAALATLSSVFGAANIAVTGSGPWVVTFQGTMANQGHPIITIVDGTTGGTGVVATHTTVGQRNVISIPRNVTVVANVAGVTGNVVVNGINMAGDVIAETLALNGLTVVAGNKAFASITSIVFPTRTHSGDTVNVGIGDKLGLHHTLSNNTVIFAFINNVKEVTAPTVTTDAVHLESNTFTLNSDLSVNPGQVVDIYYIVGA